MNELNFQTYTIVDVIFSGQEEETYYEEIANSFTHLLGMLMAIIAVYMLILVAIEFRKSKAHVFGCLVYAMCLMLLYILSTAYHSVGVFYTNDRAVREFWQRWDHVAIYFMIAGSATPMFLLNLVTTGKHPKLGYFVLCTVWICAAIGTWAKLFIGPKDIPPMISNGFYLFMGWFPGMLVLKPLLTTCPGQSVRWQLYSGIVFSIGVTFLIWDSLHFNHAIWHLHVIAGSFCGFISILVTAILTSGSERFKDVKPSNSAFEIIKQFLAAELSAPNYSEDAASVIVPAGAQPVKRIIRNKI